MDELSEGQGRTQINLRAQKLGKDRVVTIYNRATHVGAVALAEYDPQSGRASVSVLTKLGHKDDPVAYEAAHSISKATRQAACVIVGIHLDDVTQAEIADLVENSRRAVERFIATLEKPA
jgi:hypothetical protein